MRHWLWNGFFNIRAASRPNCELIASCPIALSHSSSTSYDEGRWKEK
jgi:hypothetical protein